MAVAAYGRWQWHRDAAERVTAMHTQNADAKLSIEGGSLIRQSEEIVGLSPWKRLARRNWYTSRPLFEPSLYLSETWYTHFSKSPSDEDLQLLTSTHTF